MADPAYAAAAHRHRLLRRIDPHPLYQRRVDHQANVPDAPGPLIRRREWRRAGCFALEMPRRRRTWMTRRSARGIDRLKSGRLSPGSGRENGGKYLRLAAGRTEAERHPHEMRNGAGPQLMHDGGPMVLGRARGDAQLTRD